LAQPSLIPFENFIESLHIKFDEIYHLAAYPDPFEYFGKLIDTATNHPIEFRICDSEQYVQTQIADWNKRFRMNEPKEDEE
jgi:hypothetical protein